MLGINFCFMLPSLSKICLRKIGIDLRNIPCYPARDMEYFSHWEMMISWSCYELFWKESLMCPRWTASFHVFSYRNLKLKSVIVKPTKTFCCNLLSPSQGRQRRELNNPFLYHQVPWEYAVPNHFLNILPKVPGFCLILAILHWSWSWSKGNKV